MFETPIEELLNVKRPLRTDRNGKFRVLVLSDLHGGIGQSAQLPAAIDAMVEAAAPDLVLLNGDVSGCSHIHASNAEELRRTLEESAGPMERRGIPWCHTFGNHDANYGLSNAEAEAVYESFPMCVSKAGEPELSGAGNYVLPVLGRDGKVAFAVWALDSHDNLRGFAREFGLPEDTRFQLPVSFCQGRDYDTVHVNQVVWYYLASRTLEKHVGGKVPGLMCFHIALPEYCLISRNRGETRYHGSERENVGCGEMNSGLFLALLERGDVKHVCVGHDHINDFSGTYCGVTLSYDGGLTYDGYQDDDLRGGRVYDFDEADPWNVKTFMLRVRDVMGVGGNKLPEEN